MNYHLFLFIFLFLLQCSYIRIMPPYVITILNVLKKLCQLLSVVRLLCQITAYIVVSSPMPHYWNMSGVALALAGEVAAVMIITRQTCWRSPNVHLRECWLTSPLTKADKAKDTPERNAFTFRNGLIINFDWCCKNMLLFRQ